ncbi:MAG: CopG family transcriptional regulator [Candidatus Desulfacyla sp.]
MATVKTAISIDEALFQQMEAMAKELDVSRSRLFVLAARDFLGRHRNKALLEAINDAYDDMPSEEENQLHVEMHNRHCEAVKETW